METRNVIAKRRAVRSYKPDQISSADLEKILTAGCAAPVGRGKYEDLHLTVLQDKELITKLSKTIAETMKNDMDALYGTPTLILLSSKESVLPNIEYTNAGCIAENMMLQAADLGSGSVIIWSVGMTLEKKPELKKEYGIPEEHKALFGVALGYPADDVKEKELKLAIEVSYF